MKIGPGLCSSCINRHAWQISIVLMIAMMLMPVWPLPSTSSKVWASPPADEEEMVKLTFPADLQVKVLVEYVSKSLGMNILYDETVGRQRVTLSSPAPIPKSSLPDLLSSVLRMGGLMLVDADQPGWKKIVPARNLLDYSKSIQTDSEVLRSAADASVYTKVFSIQHARIDLIEKLVQPLLSKPGGNCFSISDFNMLIATDYADCLRRIEALLELADRPREEAQIKFIRLRHAKAVDVARSATTLLKEKQRIQTGALGGERASIEQWSISAESQMNQVVVIAPPTIEPLVMDIIESLDIPLDLETHSYRFSFISPQRMDRLASGLSQHDVTPNSYKATIDVESGLLIVTASASIHQRLVAMKDLLDVPEVELENRFIRFYKLKNTTASEVLATIQSLDSGKKTIAALAGKTVQETAAADTGQVQQSASATPAPQEPAREPPLSPVDLALTEKTATFAEQLTARTADAVITSDRNTNTLIVIAPPAAQQIYRELILMLDRRRPQVMMEISLVTLDTSEGFTLGVELSHSSRIGSDHRYITFSSFGLSTVDPQTGALSLVPGIGFNGAIIGNETFNAVIRALATSGRAKVVSSPKILVNDHSTATLSSIAEQPFVSINASQTVSTTSFAGYAAAGTTLTVTPHISEGDHIKLEYSVTLNSFSGEGVDGIPPPRQTNTLNSQVTVPDGFAVIAGGLKRTDQSNTVSKIPFLGDIPLLGRLFQLSDSRKSESTLFVFIRPVILRDDQFEDLKYLSERHLTAAGMPRDLPPGRALIMN